MAAHHALVSDDHDEATEANEDREDHEQSTTTSSTSTTSTTSTSSTATTMANCSARSDDELEEGPDDDCGRPPQTHSSDDDVSEHERPTSPTASGRAEDGSGSHDD